jgi:hypothetical protein
LSFFRRISSTVDNSAGEFGRRDGAGESERDVCGGMQGGLCGIQWIITISAEVVRSCRIAPRRSATMPEQGGNGGLRRGGQWWEVGEDGGLSGRVERKDAGDGHGARLMG